MELETDLTAGRRFVLQRTLGEGAFGTVYLAEMEGAGGFRRRVALKLLNRNWEAGSDAGRRLRDEARLLGRLQHRNILRVDDLVRLNGQWALVMEYIRGADLELLFNQARHHGLSLPARAVLDIVACVASALDVAWSAEGEGGQPLRVIHRDIKPSNVLLSETGDVKVLDFGVARADFGGREAKTERVRYGSLGYMAPERFARAPEGPAGDVYSVGVMLYELLTLEAYGRTELTPEAQDAQVGRAETVLLERLGPEGGPVVDLFSRALSFDPEKRPTAGELAMELRAIAPTFEGPELAQFVASTFPLIGISGPVERDEIDGTVLEEGVRTLDTPVAARTGGEAPPATDSTSIPSADPFAAAPEEPPPGRGWKFAVLGIAAVGIVALVAAFSVIRVDSTAEPAAAPVAAPVQEAASPAPAGSTSPPPEASPEPAPTGVAAAPPSSTVAPGESAPKAATAAKATEAKATPAKATANPAAKATPAAPTVAAPPAAAAPTEAAPPAGGNATPPASATASSSARLRAAKFTLTGAEGISVTCGDVRASGATSALVREFPAGACSVSAAGHTTSVTVDEPRGVTCAVEGDSLACR